MRALLFAFAVLANPTMAQDRLALVEFGVTAGIPAGFGPPDYSDRGDGALYTHLSEPGYLSVYGGYDWMGGIDQEYEFTLVGLSAEGAEITYQFLDETAFALSGFLADGRIFYRYGRAGENCDGDAVIGMFYLVYETSDRVTFDPMASDIVDGLTVGCG